MTTPFRTALSNTVHALRGSGERHHEIDPDGDVLLVLKDRTRHLCEPDDWSVSMLKTEAEEEIGTKSKKDKKKKKKQRALSLSERLELSEHATIATTNGPETNESPLVGVEVNRTPPRPSNSSFHRDIKFVVSSRYFKKALSELWAKTLVHSEDGRRHIQEKDWDADALLILMQIFHARTQNIPRSVDLEQLAKIAVLVDYYDCHDTVEFFVTLWIHSLQEQLSLQCNRELVLWLLVSVVFRRDDLFQAVTKIAVTKSKGPLPTLELPVLQSPIDQIDKRRQDAIADILGTLDKLGSDLLRGSTGCDFDCSCALFGALAKNMVKHNLMDPVPRAPFLGYGITALEKAVNVAPSVLPRTVHIPSNAFNAGADFTNLYAGTAIGGVALLAMTVDQLGKLGKQLSGIKDELEVQTAAIVQGWHEKGFGSFIYDFAKTEIDEYDGDASVGKHAFYIYNPTTSAEIVFKQKVKEQPLPSSFGGISDDIEAIFRLMWANRQALRATMTREEADKVAFHLLVPAKRTWAMVDPLVIDESIGRLTIKGHMDEGSCYASFNFGRLPPQQVKMAARNAQDTSLYLARHIFLPSQLPQSDDSAHDNDIALLRCVYNSLGKFGSHVTESQQEPVALVTDMVHKMLTAHKPLGGRTAVDEAKLAEILRHVLDSLGLHIREQNAGVLISRVGSTLRVEAFELSACNKDVTMTTGRLRRTFPGTAVSINLENAREDGFITTLAATLSKMSTQPSAETKPKAKKAGQLQDENRDTTHPKMVTELLHAFLLAVGQPTASDRVWKNTREEVLWRQVCLPWRRSPMWMLIRVVLQLSFIRLAGSPQYGVKTYKLFMVFLMANVLQKALDVGLDSDILYAMTAKCSRRLLKIGREAHASALDYVHNQMRYANSFLRERWAVIRNKTSIDLTTHFSRLKTIDFSQDIVIALPGLDGFLDSIRRRQVVDNSRVFIPSWSLTKYDGQSLPRSIDPSDADHLPLTLVAFETWVEMHLEHWMSSQLAEDYLNTCLQLRHLIESYHNAASSMYCGNPETTSIMLLTILELWVACDKATVHAHPLLADYDPGIPRGLFQNFLLPLRRQMRRIFEIERYLVDRSSRSNSRLSAFHIYKSFGASDSFSLRYFQQSTRHQELLLLIEADATKQREAKRCELKRVQDRYKALMKKYGESECTYVDNLDHYSGGYYQTHSARCTRCGYQKEAQSLQIYVHEWPLPRQDLQKKSVVFELELPQSFGHWREASFYVLLDVLKVQHANLRRPQSQYPLRNYDALRPYHQARVLSQNVQLLSETKPNAVVHRNPVVVASATEANVLLNNGLQFMYHDKRRSCFIQDLSVTDKIPHSCTYRLPLCSASLQKFLFRPAAEPCGPPPNLVIATQSACPKEMTVEEYKAVASIPLGVNIQYQNILVQLFSPMVDFKKWEVTLTIWQCIYQAGPGSGHAVRSAHDTCEDEQFASKLLEGITDATQRFEQNWQSSAALATLISLACRLLTLTRSVAIETQCLDYLREARKITFQWALALREKAHNCLDDDEKISLQRRALGAFLISSDTFNTDANHQQSALSQTEEACLYFQYAIYIQEYSESLLSSLDAPIGRLHARWQRTLHHCYRYLAMADNVGAALDHAILASWPAYRSSGVWTVLSDDHDHWLTSTTVSPNAQSVHFSLVTGEFLVDGVPLDHLPAEYLQHPAYHTLFGRLSLDIMLSSIPGMQYSCTASYAGHKVHVSLGGSRTSAASTLDLLVHASQNQTKYDLVPSRHLRGSFPRSFIENHVHWYNHNEDCVEFCDSRTPWHHATSNWKLRRSRNGREWSLHRDEDVLIGINKDSSLLLASILEPLEDKDWIHIIQRNSKAIFIDLPRTGLEFTLEPGTSAMVSKQYRGMVIDSLQSIGSLIGMRDKLVLRTEHSLDTCLTPRRRVLVMDGNVSHVATADHVQVDIAKDSYRKVHTYDVDEKLGRLVSNGSLQSKLFLACLHALTSFCLPDPLTGKTGTEEALTILGSASAKSFDCLSHENVQLLSFIARLTPGRSYYPAHERVMQTVHWDQGLSFLSQHGLFLDRVRSIFDHASRVDFLFPDRYVKPPALDHADAHLLDRDNIRSSTFRISGFGAERHCTTKDKDYEPRDRSVTSSSSKSHSVARMVFSNQPALFQSLPPSFGSHLRDYLKQISEVSYRSGTSVITEIAYDSGLLLESTGFIAKNWIDLHRDVIPGVCKFKLLIWLATLAFATSANIAVLQTLASFRTFPQAMQLSPPAGNNFQLSKGAKVDSAMLQKVILSGAVPYNSSPEANLARNSYESSSAYDQRRSSQFKSKLQMAVNTLVSCLRSQGVCKVPEIPLAHQNQNLWRTYIRINHIIPVIKTHFRTWYDNLLLERYVNTVASNMPSVIRSPQFPCPLLTNPDWSLSGARRFITGNDIFRRAKPPPPVRGLHILYQETLPESRKYDYRMPELISMLRNRTQGTYERRYVEELDASFRALQRKGITSSNAPGSAPPRKEVLMAYLRQWKEEVDRQYDAIAKALLGLEDKHPSTAIEVFDLYCRPRTSPLVILQRLNKDHVKNTPTEWRERIADYGVAMTQLQRAERMVASMDDPPALESELRNPGHANWNPLDYPDTLLLEIDSGLMVREVQESVAKSMRDPPSSKNTTMQLLMGEGKSSVILPIVAAALADGSRIVRIFVSKPQSKQTQQMLESQLGGLVNRRLYHLPFSRATRVGPAEVEALALIFIECMTSGGILFVQPEHILSFKLMGVETAITGKMDVSRPLLQLKDFMDRKARDIVDESDENFSVKFELVYTVGTQQSIEHSPDRWICIHHVLGVVRGAIAEVEKSYPDSIELSQGRPGCFPRLRILRDDAKDKLIDLVSRQLSQEGSTGLPIATQPRQVQSAVWKYITKFSLSQAEIEAVEKCRLWSPLTKNTLLLFRGLLASQILAFVFCQKRWKVDYGLDPTRNPTTQLAVPFRAKDSPSARSEFSHPEIIIMLTSLSYYYGGMTDEDLRTTFIHLLRSDQADMEYQVWVADSDYLPHAFGQLSGINLDDREQCTEQLFPCFRYAKGAIDYFLAHVVLPKELKEFPHKLSASGWDVGEEKTQPMTGFSGTNDARAFLPLAVSQLDDGQQQHTNAQVLEYLLQDDTLVTLMPKQKTAGRFDAEVLLEMVTHLKPPTRVILDVGAQILELDNLGVAQRWLEITEDSERTQAVIFCDENDRLCVVDRRGRVESFQTSPFAGQVDVCLVFLDEAHTRGTDLKLPADYRAAVTLGASLTKDRLVQACMRMRKLGKGQSVTFCVPDEIQQKITSRQGDDGRTITVSDILEWAISETYTEIRRGILLWANQGRRHNDHRILWEEARIGGSTDLDTNLAKRFLEEEAQTLEQRYRPKPPQNPRTGETSSLSSIEGPDAIVERLIEFDGLEEDSATFREEQERELSPEIEQEREIQRPPSEEPAEHFLHPDIKRFVSHGVLPKDSKSFTSAFQALSNTTAARHFDAGRLSTSLLASSDFVHTIKSSRRGQTSDLFQRSVQWILTRHSSNGFVDTAIIVSPFEAQELIPDIKRSKFTSLRLYSPRPNMGFKSLDDLSLYTIPHPGVFSPTPALSLRTELNLFSGQLYLKSMEEYRSIQQFFRLSPEPSSSDQTISRAPDMGTEALMQFIKVLMTQIRRNCESIDKTYMGRILDHRVLEPSDFS
ncbi:hypothetical protein CcaCcLH18_11994 [Colletotrichum camelliae]|nr:hypothetical protein CcaCcLH18_11994 [Colletotrichum camelliae]